MKSRKICSKHFEQIENHIRTDLKLQIDVKIYD